jgi:hypothetical protein
MLLVRRAEDAQEFWREYDSYDDTWDEYDRQGPKSGVGMATQKVWLMRRLDNE